MFAKYAKSRVYTCHVYNWLAWYKGRAVNKFYNVWLDPFTLCLQVIVLNHMCLYM